MTSNITKNEVHHSSDRAVIREFVTRIKTTEKAMITYNFFNHFHPFVGELIEQLNKKSLAGLFDVDFQSELEIIFFEDEYHPNISDTLKVNYPNKELDLSEGGPYSVYNWELFFHAPLAIAVHLSKNQRFAEAQRWFHFIFDPTSNDKSVNPSMKFWKFRQFREDSELCILVKFSEGLGIFDQHYGSPQIDEQEIYDGPTGKVIDIQGIQAHAGRNYFVPGGKEFSLNIDQYPYLQIAIKAEPGTNTCLFLLVHEREHDWNRRFVVIGKTSKKGECGHHLMSNYFRIKDDNEWHEYVYDLRTIREEKDDNIYHQPICQDAGSIREIQLYSWTRSGTHTFYFNNIIAQAKQKEDMSFLKSIDSWRDNPFQPHVVARNRVLAYQFYVVMKYLDNLIAWGDSLFRQDTIETINEATQIYVLAANILGPKPQKISRMGITQPKTYAMLKGKRDPLGNALVDMEGRFPFNLNIPSTRNSATSQTNTLFGIAKTLYFCILQNDKLLGYWDTVADRLFKIRYCMSIEGIVRQLPLFEPPIDPGMLVKAAAAGIDISSVVSGLNQPVSLVRAPLIIQKALEICSEVKTLGNALLSALEKKDAEELALLRQGHEIKILQLVEDVKYLQWKDSEAATEALLKTREITYQRYRHYQLILGMKDDDLGEIKDITIEKKELNEDNFDEVYNELVAKYGNLISLEEYRKEQTGGDLIEQAAGTVSGILGSGDGARFGDGANLQLNRSESKELNTFMPQAHDLQQDSAVYDLIASVLSLIPQFNVHATPLGIGVATGFGGQQLSTFASIGAKLIRLDADEMSYMAIRASKLATYQRRIDDWVLQNNLAASELMQIGRQIISSLIREQIVKNEYENHKKQIEHAREIDTFLKEKFTNQDFYTWMQGEISKIYYECYKFAFDIAKKAEQTMKHELMRKELDDMNFIKFNYWDSGRKGLLSGEALYLDLKRMEMAYHDHNKREYEMIKHVSLQQLNPNALLQLKATGSCEITIPEWLFDMDGPGHYMRRIKTVSLSIPCVTGPYTSVNCTLSLLKSTIRQTSLLKDGEYGRDGSEDNRFKDYFGAIQSIVTSSGQNDSGLFETNLRDERYLPFEGAGAESTWKIELPSDSKDKLPLPRMFDYNTISDLILHLRYTAREGGALKSEAVKQIEELVKDTKESGLARSFSLKHDFSTEWHRFVNSTEDENLKIDIKKDHFPYIAQGFDIKVSKIQLFAITDGELKPRNIDNIPLNTVNDDINDIAKNNQAKLAIASDAKVLTRDKEAQVFLVLSYYLE